jgi:hypothetical protein
MNAPVTNVRPWGMGMPAWLYLHEFGDVLLDAFGYPAYLVGSALTTKTPRDIDVRLPLSTPDFINRYGAADTFGRAGTRWGAEMMAFSALGQQITGKVIDFQVQHSGIALIYRDEPSLRIGTRGGDK